MLFESLGKRLLLAAFSWPSNGASNIQNDDIQIGATIRDGVSGIIVTQVQAGGTEVFYPDCTELTINLGDGNDRMIVGNTWLNTTVYGGSGNDTITTGYAPDYISGEGGADAINAGAGADFVEGSSGNDEIQGHDDADTLLGGGGDDVIYGNSISVVGSYDRSSDDDNISGGDGYDTVMGQFGTDDIAGGPGHDVLTLGTSGGISQGGAGNDSLIGGAGADNLNGNEGNDFFFTIDGIQDYAIRGGGDFDTLVEYDAIDLLIPPLSKRLDSIEKIQL